MKRYTGKLCCDLSKSIEDNKLKIENLIKRGLTGLNAPKGQVTSFEKSIEMYNAGISKDEIKAWVWYKRTTKSVNDAKYIKIWKDYVIPLGNTKEILQLVKSGALFIENKKYVPISIFTFGNIYSKLNHLEDDKAFIIENFGQSVYENHKTILEAAKPKQLSINNPIASERPVILAISKFARDHKIESLDDGNGVILNEPKTLIEAYRLYLFNLPEDEFERRTNAYNIINYYLNATQKPRNIEPTEWQEIQKNAQQYGEKLFKKFLHEALTFQDKVKIDGWYNMNYNAVAPLNYTKVPVAFEVSKTFLGNELGIRPAQREAIGFMEITGSGILAYDVGVGKTISAIIEGASALQSGKCKRILIVVPNPTYDNWIKEMFGTEELAGILSGTDITLNKWYNLGTDYEKRLSFDKPVPENSITLVTYEGMQKIGISDDSSLFNELGDILDQDTLKTNRDAEKRNEKYREMIGFGNKDTIADIEVLGFDYMIIDEAHNFKNIFTDVKSDDKEDGAKRFHIQAGSPSTRGIKAFFLANYIQRNFGRNVLLLTATPFTNSPLEIYSMLSLVAYDYMKTWGIINIKLFFEQYILETSEPVVTTSGEIAECRVVKSFNNRISLQKLINSHINFKTGEEVSIPRPCKINLPKTTETINGETKRLPQSKQIVTYLKMTEEQQEIQRGINLEAAKPTSKDDPGKQLRLMSQSLNNALSPFIYLGTMPTDYMEFVESSPKVLYTLEAIRSVKNWHEKRNEQVSGQVIYMDRGKDYFPLIKEYLNQELGYKTNVKMADGRKVDEVEIITSGITPEKKEKIKLAFNEGSCKIIIGTSTIKEGINLQQKSTVLYNLYPNWNPTDIRQLEGRIWRQKNEFGFVRVVMPLIENSMDVFVFQKLEEKTARINDLWNQSDRGNVLDEEALDPNEVKFALITDIGVLVRNEIKNLTAESSRNISIIKNNIQSLSEYQSTRESYENGKFLIRNKIRNKLKNLDYAKVLSKDGMVYYFKDMYKIVYDDLNQTQKDAYDRFNKNYNEVTAVDIDNATDKELIQTTAKVDRLNDEYYNSTLENFKDSVSRYQKIKKTLFDARGYNEGSDVSIIRTELENDLILANTEHDALKSEEFYQKLFNQIAEKKEKMNIKGGTLENRVEDFKRLNYLLSYKFVDIDFRSCTIPESEKFTNNDADKQKRINLAKAKMKMAAAKLKLVA
jgi:hypothetical protein